ncbi:MAG TPA: gluconate 2-dehydrogenase subunit 3 family protein [Nitrospiraceae bacterium]|jgi:hypothetical protein|nr:gluconate 2-dehydrogenase subunit 3 family protein [Nitrospiraceae bacterium]
MHFDFWLTRRQALKFTIWSFWGVLVLKSFLVKAEKKLSLEPSKKPEIWGPTTQGNLTAVNSVLTDMEVSTLRVLADGIIPSNKEGPGATQAAVADRIAESLAHNPALRVAYQTGLSEIDQLARSRYGFGVTSLRIDQRHQLLSFLDELHRTMFLETGSLVSRIRGKAYYWYYVKWGGLGSTLEFWRQLQSDVLAHFYSSPVAWAWLGYDGPPFPLGYLKPPSCNLSENPA